MKKKVVLLFVAVMAMATIFAGCGKEGAAGNSAAPEVATSAEAEAEVITYSTEDILSAIDYDIKEAVKLPEGYKEYEIQLERDYTITDEMVDTYLDTSILPYYKDFTEVDREAKEGDTVNIDYEGKKDGVAFDGGTAEGTDLELGSGSFIPGFEDGLIGTKAGDTVDLNLTFPEDYPSFELAGKEVVFTVTVNAVKEGKAVGLDELTDEYVEKQFSQNGITTVDELRATVKTNLDYENDAQRTEEIQDKLLTKLIDESTIIYPDSIQAEIDEAMNSMMESAQKEADTAEKTLDEYIADTYNGQTVEEHKADIMDYIDSTYKQSLITAALVADQAITVTSTDIEASATYYLQRYGANYGFTSVDNVYDYFGGKENFILASAKNAALAQVMDGITVLDAE